MEAYTKNAYQWKVQVAFPDGSEKDFRPLGYGSEDNGFWNISPNGKLYDFGWYQIPPAPPNCSNNSSQVSTSGMVYYTTDGSYIRLFIAHDQDDDETNNPYTVYFPDGSYFQSSNGRLTDRNGNYLEPVSFQYNGKNASGIGDQLGRKIFLTSGDSPNELFVYGNGPNGTPIKWKIRYKMTNVRRHYRTTGAGSIRGRGGASNQVLLSEWDVVDEIILPPEYGSLKYEFGYNGSDEELRSDEQSDGFGELSYIRLPSGAEAFYEYSIPGWPDSNTYPPSTDFALRNAVSKKTVRHYTENDGSSNLVEEEWQYAIGPTGATVTSPDGSVMTQIHGNTAYQDAYSGLVKSIERANGSKVERLWGFYGSGPTGINPFVKAEFVSIKDATGNYVKTAIKTFTQDRNGNPTSVSEYDFVPYGEVPRTNGFPTGLPQNIGAPVRSTYTEYYNGTPDSSDTTTQSNYSYWDFTGPRNLTRRVIVKNASTQTVSQTEITYDDPLTTANPTLTRVWDSTKGAVSSPLTDNNSVKSQATYNSYGMPLTTTDANGTVTEITYGNITAPTGYVADLYPTQTVAAYGTPLARTSTATYDFYTGAVLTTTDVDNGVTNAMVYDDLGRPTKAITAQGTNLESWTQTEYDDVNRRVIVRSDLETVGDGKKVATQFFDQLGRVRLSKTLEDSATQSATNETDGIKVQARYKTVSGYTYQLSSNPYRAATSSAETDATMGWTLSTAWSHGRRAETETFAGAGLPTVFGGSNTNSTGIVRTDIDANTTTVTDQAGKLRRSVTNGLGQLIRVDEPDDSSSTGSLGSISSPNQATSYAYDTLNNLTTVTQGAQTRTFTYNSLSRLLTATNPESGTIQYGYDPNGNLTTKTDARSITTTYAYDALNRVTQRSYSDSTRAVSYFYDNLTNAKGKLTKVSSSVSTTEYTAFDILGRVTGHKQTTDGQEYATGYVYNLSGALVEQTYPSGRVVKNVLDANGDLSMVQSKKDASAGYWNYAENFTYNPAGAVTSLQLGNGQWQSNQYNSRMQMTAAYLGLTQNTSNLLKLDLDYGTTQNNGNLLSQVITVPTVGVESGFSATQNYTYDSLNRLKTANEVISSTETWKQTFVFDRYGNRNFDESNTTTLPKSCMDGGNPVVCTADRKIFNPSVNQNNNRLNTSEDYSYDSTGNTTNDPQGRLFKYDGENKQYEVRNSSNETIGQYFFDGNGKRVKKFVPSTDEVTVFVYDAMDKLIAEYSTNLSPEPTVAYTTSDHLGSPRIKTNENGAVISRNDYLPFGEDLYTAQRTQTLGYSSDDIRQKFTGYERDDEIDLDFAQARYYNSGHGRFTSPDPYKIVAEIEFEETEEKARAKLNRYLGVPQQWNRYSYTINNPLKYTDPTGEVIYLSGNDADVKKAHERLKNLLGDERYNLIKQSSDGRILYLNEGDVCGSNCSKFASIGDTPLNKEFSRKFAAILSSPEKVRFRIALEVSYFKVDQKGNKTQALRDVRKESGGGVTIPANESISGDIEIWVAPDAASTANRLAPFGKPHLTNDGRRLNFQDNSVVDGHEFGHGYDELFGQTGNSIRFENAVRERFPGQQRRKSEK
ncbi:MAG: RHS repeat-associated core domain-containing protein [Acidobacteriota bacterium]|nr:MAG: RHS repeat-associated core domain-containing protein [Acidobacteriota bacterium]